MLESTYRPGTLNMLECRFNKTTHHEPFRVVGHVCPETMNAMRKHFLTDLPITFVKLRLDDVVRCFIEATFKHS